MLIEMRGELSGGKVVVEGSEAEILGFRGFGKKKDRIVLSLEEAAVLLETSKLVITDEGGTDLTLAEFLKLAVEIAPKFGVRYLVYRDLKGRGYVVQPGRADFWLYPRGVKPGEKPARYFVRIFSERDCISVKELGELLILARNMRKEPILAVADEESDVTYYEVKEAKLETQEGKEGGDDITEKVTVTLLGDRVILWDTDVAEYLYRTYFFGTLTKEKRLLLSFPEAVYLMKRGLLELNGAPLESQYSNVKPLNGERLIKYARSIEPEFMDKYQVYADLMEKGLIVKTGFKFGSHFRVYRATQQKHSLYLIHMLPEDHVFTLPELSRAVRLAHGVKKRMIFAFREQEGGALRYVDVGRMKL
jgi:tRNA-intron endonuclease